MIFIFNGIFIIILWIGIVMFNVLKINEPKHLKLIMILELIVLIAKTIEIMLLKI